MSWCLRCPIPHFSTTAGSSSLRTLSSTARAAAPPPRRRQAAAPVLLRQRVRVKLPEYEATAAPPGSSTVDPSTADTKDHTWSKMTESSRIAASERARSAADRRKSGLALLYDRDREAGLYGGRDLFASSPTLSSLLGGSADIPAYTAEEMPSGLGTSSPAQGETTSKPQRLQTPDRIGFSSVDLQTVLPLLYRAFGANQVHSKHFNIRYLPHTQLPPTRPPPFPAHCLKPRLENKVIKFEIYGTKAKLGKYSTKRFEARRRLKGAIDYVVNGRGGEDAVPGRGDLLSENLIYVAEVEQSIMDVPFPELCQDVLKALFTIHLKMSSGDHTDSRRSSSKQGGTRSFKKASYGSSGDAPNRPKLRSRPPVG